MIKVLNLYAGIGGNRKLWENVEVTAVEWDDDIAKVYQESFPDDEVIVSNAMAYLLLYYDDFDFIWSSPPCQSHSVTNHFLHKQGVRRYPEMDVYKQILFLKQWCKVPWVVENVKSYYEPLVRPYECGGHYFWSSFPIPKKRFPKRVGTFNRQASKEKQREAETDQNKRNAVNPELGLFIFNCAFKEKQQLLEVGE